MIRLSNAALLMALLLAGCEQSPTDGDTSAERRAPAMPGMPQAASAEHVAEGTVNSIDLTAGTVSISHGPVASADWPAMTMSFKLADPRAAADIVPSQRVEFHFTIESGMSATVTQISPAD
jgi:Cu(I)/Ag(I) efflux system membrane fusion protein